MRQKVSHVIMINEKGVRVVIPVHPGKNVKPGLIRATIKRQVLKEKNSSNFSARLKSS